MGAIRTEEKPRGKASFGKPMRKWEYNIGVDEVGSHDTELTAGSMAPLRS
jgi:hypothetical protein